MVQECSPKVSHSDTYVMLIRRYSINDIQFWSYMTMLTVEFTPGVIAGSDSPDEMKTWKVWSPSMTSSLSKVSVRHIGEGVMKSEGAKVTLDLAANS